MTKPTITNVGFYEHGYDIKRGVGHYGFTLTISNISSAWAYDREIYEQLKRITPSDILEWLNNSNKITALKQETPQITGQFCKGCCMLHDDDYRFCVFKEQKKKEDESLGLC